MTTWFVTGTDTDVGKTVFTGLFAKQIIDLGQQVVTQKWVQTGVGLDQSDVMTHYQLMNQNPDHYQAYQKAILPYCFSLAASPHLAADCEQQTIDLDRLLMSLRFLEKQFL